MSDMLTDILIYGGLYYLLLFLIYCIGYRQGMHNAEKLVKELVERTIKKAREER